jgi:hypothetical protein
MAATGFKVFIRGQSGSVEDWRRALGAPDSELPELGKEEKEVARRMQIPEKEYARGVLVGIYAEKRKRQRGEKLGSEIERLLIPLGSYYQLKALTWDGTELKWSAKILSPKRVVEVAIPFEVADDVVDSGDSFSEERLKQLLLEALGRTDLVSEDRQ